MISKSEDPPPFPKPLDLRPAGIAEALKYAGQWAAAAVGLPGDEHVLRAVCQKQGWGVMRFNRSILDQPIVIGGKTFTHGFGTHADSEIVLHANQPIRRFRAWAGMDGSIVCRGGNAGGSERLIFAVEAGGGRELWRSPALGVDTPAVRIDTPVPGGTEVTLKVWDVNSDSSYAHADWADVELELADGTTVSPIDCAYAAQPLPYDTPPFSFTFGGRASAELLTGWRVTRSSKPCADGVTGQLVIWHDPQTGLECELELQTFEGFPAAEWLLRFRNTGTMDTPLLENIQPLDTVWAVTGETQLRRSRGSQSSVADFEYLVTPLAEGETISMAAGGGRSSNNWLPFFNLQSGDSGVITGIGWTGQWAASLTRGTAGGELRIRAGQELTHLVLHPGEEIRTPRIMQLFWNGAPQTSHNTLRRFILAHHTPRPDGELLRGPLTTGHWGGMRTSEHLERIEAYRQHGIDNEYYWIDAGWYGPPESFSPEESTGEWAKHVGDWRINPVGYPQGFRPISDAAIAAGTKLLLWFEPERAVVGTPLPIEHPEWFLGERKPGASLLLDLGNLTARRWLIDFISDCLTTQGVHLYRQDFNVDPLPYWRAADAPDRQGMSEIRHIEGLYAFWDELLRRHPGLIIDNCASGGRRLDLETCSRSIPLWRSDWQCGPHFDPVGCQVEGMGLNYWLPLSACGTGVRPGDTYNFRSSLSAALCFHLAPSEGTPLRPDYPYDWHRRMLAEARRARPLFYGDYYPLSSCRPEHDQWAAYQMHRPDIGEGFVLALRRPEAHFVSADFRLHGLDFDTKYEFEDAETGRTWQQSGQELRERGVRLILETAPESRLLFYRRKVDKE